MQNESQSTVETKQPQTPPRRFWKSFLAVSCYVVGYTAFFACIYIALVFIIVHAELDWRISLAISVGFFIGFLFVDWGHRTWLRVDLDLVTIGEWSILALVICAAFAAHLAIFDDYYSENETTTIFTFWLFGFGAVFALLGVYSLSYAIAKAVKSTSLAKRTINEQIDAVIAATDLPKALTRVGAIWTLLGTSMCLLVVYSLVAEQMTLTSSGSTVNFDLFAELKRLLQAAFQGKGASSPRSDPLPTFELLERTVITFMGFVFLCFGLLVHQRKIRDFALPGILAFMFGGALLALGIDPRMNAIWQRTTFYFNRSVCWPLIILGLGLTSSGFVALANIRLHHAWKASLNRAPVDTKPLVETIKS